MEYLDTFDKNEKFYKKHLEREYVHDMGLWHKEVLIIVINEKKEILLQQRSYNKRFLAGKWGLIGGHVTSGESELTTACRELREEVGLKKNKDDLIFVKKIKRADKTNKKIQYIYVALTKNKVSDFIINTEEIRKLKYMSLNEIIKRINSKDYSIVFTRSPKFHLKLFNEIFGVLK